MWIWGDNSSCNNNLKRQLFFFFSNLCILFPFLKATPSHVTTFWLIKLLMLFPYPLSVLELPINGYIQYIIPGMWLLSLITVYQRLIHAILCVNNLFFLLLSSIPSPDCAIKHFFNNSADEHWIKSSFRLLWVKLLSTFSYWSLLWTESCPPLQICMLNPKPPCDCILRWGSKEEIKVQWGHKGKGPSKTVLAFLWERQSAYTLSLLQLIWFGINKNKNCVLSFFFIIWLLSQYIAFLFLAS